MAIINSGLILRVLPKTTFDFGTVKPLGASITFPLVQHISAEAFTEGTWMIRIHSGTFTGGTLTFTSVVEGYDFGDPGLTFSTNGGTLVVSSAPLYNVLAVQTGSGRLLRLDLTATQTGAATQPLNATISVDLALKGGDGSFSAAPNEFFGYGVQ